jgi:hypothetical protein
MRSVGGGFGYARPSSLLREEQHQDGPRMKYSIRVRKKNPCCRSVAHPANEPAASDKRKTRDCRKRCSASKTCAPTKRGHGVRAQSAHLFVAYFRYSECGVHGMVEHGG